MKSSTQLVKYVPSNYALRWELEDEGRVPFQKSIRELFLDFPGTPEVKTLSFQLQQACVWSLVRELKIPCAAQHGGKKWVFPLNSLWPVWNLGTYTMVCMFPKPRWVRHKKSVFDDHSRSSNSLIYDKYWLNKPLLDFWTWWSYSMHPWSTESQN